jgi:hypothetical protein
MPRPSKHSREPETLILNALRTGATRTDACATAGIHLDTLAGWQKVSPGLSERLEEAEAEAVLFFGARIAKAAREAEVAETFARQGNLLRRITKYDWRAAAWWLEHHPRTRGNWAATAKVEVSGPDGGPVETRDVIKWVPDEAWMRQYARVAREVEADDADDLDDTDDSPADPAV